MLEPVLDWNTLHAGDTFPAASCLLDDAFVDAYLAATGETHPVYTQGHVPPLCLSLVRFTKASLGGRWPSGTLQLSQTYQSLSMLRRNQRVRLGLKIASIEQRDGKLYFEMLTRVRDEQDTIVAEMRSRQLWASPVGAGSSPAPGAPAKPRAVAPALPESLIGPLTGQFPMLRVKAYGDVAGARDPVHLDPAFAKTTPLGVNIVQGKLVATLISRLMLDHFGLPWLERGWLDLRFRRPVLIGESIQARASPEPGDSGPRYSVWCTDPRGERVIAGSAGLQA